MSVDLQKQANIVGLIILFNVKSIQNIMKNSIKRVYLYALSEKFDFPEEPSSYICGCGEAVANKYSWLNHIINECNY